MLEQQDIRALHLIEGSKERFERHRRWLVEAYGAEDAELNFKAFLKLFRDSDPDGARRIASKIRSRELRADVETAIDYYRPCLLPPPESPFSSP